MIVDIKAYVCEIILSAISEKEYDKEALITGIDSYISDNGFMELNASFNDDVIRKVITNNLASRLSGTPTDIVLFFSNYELIKRIKILDNKALKYASEVSRNNDVNYEEICELDKQLEKYICEVNGNPGLYGMLRERITEIILNLDFAKKTSPYMSQRLKNMETIT